MPWIAVVRAHLFVFLPPGAAPSMAYWDVQHLFALVCADITAVAIGLFLVVVFHLPYYAVLDDKAESCYIRAICRVEEVGQKLLTVGAFYRVKYC